MSKQVGCARPTGKMLGESESETQPESTKSPQKESEPMSLRAGMKAPDFEAPAYHKGEFTNVKLSDSLGHWVLLCFYPGDFTFV